MQSAECRVQSAECRVQSADPAPAPAPIPAPTPAPGPGSQLVFPLRDLFEVKGRESKTDVRPGSAELGQVRVQVEDDIAAAGLGEAGGSGREESVSGKHAPRLRNKRKKKNFLLSFVFCLQVPRLVRSNRVAHAISLERDHDWQERVCESSPSVPVTS